MSQNPSPKFEPFIPASVRMPEFTLRAILMGTVLGMVFGASSLYLVLKVGLTVSASIPVAVISLSVFRFLSKAGMRDSTILENNLTQTAGSAGESIAFGIGVTMPAILILGFDLELTRVMLVGLLGAILGILMMIPLRRPHIVADHGILKFPEGTACAAVLKAGANAEDRAAASPSAKAEMLAAKAAGLGDSPGAAVIFTGFGVGLLYKTCNSAFKLWKEVPEKIFGAPLDAGSASVEISPELLGVGYIIGPRIASIMCGGGVLSYLLLIPMIKFFGNSTAAAIAPALMPISEMAPDDIHREYILYIGAGAVATGGLISMVQSFPAIWKGLKGGLEGFGKSQVKVTKENLPRTEQDLSMKVVAIGLIVLMTIISLATPLHMNILGALLVLAFGFLFVTVSSRLTGEIGSSNNPTSGMTIATLLFTCLIFLAVGWTGKAYYVTALSVGAIVCVASANGGTTSQDLKTGFLLGSTPKFQQIAIVFGSFASALVLGPILLLLNDRSTVYVPIAEVAPAGLHVDVRTLPQQQGALQGPQAADDAHSYFIWQKEDVTNGPAGKYFVNDHGDAVWLVDPGINGTHSKRPDGSIVRKYSAPKATLVSYIIKGILDHKLPWALVLLGVMISLVLEMSFVPSLAFAVGVYLPLSSSAPIFVGGLVRWLVDWRMRRRQEYATMSEEKFTEESDKSPGVLLSSGYIAGGAIAGIIIAIVQGVTLNFDRAVNTWATNSNPFYDGVWSDALSLLPYLAICGFLYLVAAGKLLNSRKE